MWDSSAGSPVPLRPSCRARRGHRTPGAWHPALPALISAGLRVNRCPPLRQGPPLSKKKAHGHSWSRGPLPARPAACSDPAAASPQLNRNKRHRTGGAPARTGHRRCALQTEVVTHLESDTGLLLSLARPFVSVNALCWVARRYPGCVSARMSSPGWVLPTRSPCVALAAVAGAN